MPSCLGLSFYYLNMTVFDKVYPLFLYHCKRFSNYYLKAHHFVKSLSPALSFRLQTKPHCYCWNTDLYNTRCIFEY